MLRRTDWLLFVVVATIALSFASGQESRQQWQRTKRVVVCDSPHRARYPSIARTADGALWVLFTRRTSQQETDQRGELVLVHSTDGGTSWSDPRVVYAARAGQPRAAGTMTTLRNDRIVAVFSESIGAQPTSKIRLLSSEDDGHSWRVHQIKADLPLVGWEPCGRILEAIDGTLAMPVFGAASPTELQASLYGCGLLRSRDGGETWGDFCWIARGDSGVIGAAHTSRFSFERPAVQPLGDGRWLALVTARRLNEGPGAAQVICRLWSRDEGRAWTEPDQLMPGSEPSLARIGKQTFCANTLEAAWGGLRLSMSRNGFTSLVQEMRLMLRDEISGHYGFASALPLDENNLVVVFGRTHNGRGHSDFPWDPPEWKDVSVDRELIMAVFFHRHEWGSDVAPPVARRPPRPSGRWVLVARTVLQGFSGAAAGTPSGDLVGVVDQRICRSADGGRTWRAVPGARLPEQNRSLSAFGVLESGRWLAATVHQNAPSHKYRANMMGARGGYRTMKIRGYREDHSVTVSYTDDQGKTWHRGKPFKGPLQSAFPTARRFIEEPDGTVALSITGSVTDEDMSANSRSNGLIRSHDGGQTWGDFSFVFRATKGPLDLQPEGGASEMDIVVLPSGNWVACARADRTTLGPRGRGGHPLLISTDRGRSWQKTGAYLAACHQQTGLSLPGGGIALTFRAHSWQGPGVAISYDEGRSIDYMLTGPYQTTYAFRSRDDEFLVFTEPAGRSDGSAGVYRWIPHNKPSSR